MSAKKRRPALVVVEGMHRPWHELVQRPAPTERKPRPVPSGPVVVVEPIPNNYRGGRTSRPHNAFTNALHLTFGAVRTRQHREAHPVRQQQRLARIEAKAGRHV